MDQADVVGKHSSHARCQRNKRRVLRLRLACRVREALLSATGPEGGTPTTSHCMPIDAPGTVMPSLARGGQAVGCDGQQRSGGGTSTTPGESPGDAHCHRSGSVRSVGQAPGSEPHDAAAVAEEPTEGDGRTSLNQAMGGKRRAVLDLLSTCARHVCSSDFLGPLYEGLKSALPSEEGRCRDVFPLPLACRAGRVCPTGWVESDWALLIDFADCVVTLLNDMYGVKLPVSISKGRVAAQTCAQTRVLECCIHLVDRLEDGVPDPWDKQGHLRSFSPRSGNAFPDLSADLVDNIERAGLCDPIPHLPPKVQSVVTHASKMFPSVSPSLSRFPRFHAGSHAEYVKLVTAQLRCGKVRLANRVEGGGTIFPVWKSGRRRQREVWNGKRVSQAAVDPMCPRHLGSPSVFKYLDASDHAQVRVTKRDGTCFFDQLRLPRALRTFMGRPPVTLGDLCSIGGLSCDEVESYLEPGASLIAEQLFPVSCVWGMGFSWSSYVAQETLLSMCKKAGLSEDLVLSSEAAAPDDFGLVFALATDDVMIFSNAGPGRSLQAGRALEAVLEEHNIQKHPGKDVDDSTCGTCLGVDLVDGRSWDPPAARVFQVISASLELWTSRRAEPQTLAGLLGVLQWFDLLQRPKLSIYEHVYDFTRRTNSWSEQDVPMNVAKEMLSAAVLSVFWSFDMSKPHLPYILATDASTSFGVGGVFARATVDEVRKIARLDAKVGDYVLMGSAVDDVSAGSRLGRPHHLGLNFGEFRTAFSTIVGHTEHINLLEARAFVTMLRWVLRSASRHGTRITLLVDSKVWLGAIAKGRSSSRSLNRFVKKAAALSFAGGLQLHCTFIPTSENPADGPSRGVLRRRRRSRDAARVPKQTRLEVHCAKMAESWRKLQASGAVDSCTDDWTPSSSSPAPAAEFILPCTEELLPTSQPHDFRTHQADS